MASAKKKKKNTGGGPLPSSSSRRRGVGCQMRAARWSRIEWRYWADAPFVRKDKAQYRCARGWSGVCGLCALTVASHPSLVGCGLGNRPCMPMEGEGEVEACCSPPSWTFLPLSRPFCGPPDPAYRIVAG
ncbi:hypothetical protein CGRA01v4_13882 [Colletotrichum graminicola]|nr:hypothetical protein CGRA01v4_13882 [Colletotrichum graminicola]